jgi:hypothetical protein
LYSTPTREHDLKTSPDSVIRHDCCVHALGYPSTKDHDFEAVGLKAAPSSPAQLVEHDEEPPRMLNKRSFIMLALLIV